MFAAFYVLAVSFIDRGSGLPVRYLAPLYVPMLVAGALILNEFFRYAEKRKPLPAPPILQNWNNGLTKRMAISAPALILMACLSLWLSQQVFSNYGNINDWMDNGRGYSSREWTGSEMVRYLRAHPPDGLIWTNQAVALHFWMDLQGWEKIYPLDTSIAKSPRHLAGE